MKITLAILADAANVSQEGRLNLLGAFQSIFTQQVPCVIPKFSIVLIFRLNYEEKDIIHNCWIRIADSDQHEINRSGPYAFRAPATELSANPECQVIINFQMLQIFQFGPHVIEFYINRDPNERNPDHELELVIRPFRPHTAEKPAE